MKRPELQYYSIGKDVTAFSSTRLGGYSEGSYGQFNINPFCGDNEETVRRNLQALCLLLGIDEKDLLLPHQTHQTNISVVDEQLLRLPADEKRRVLDGIDALMTDRRGVCIGVSTADCIPILLYDPQHRAVSAIHAGWRGTVKRIVEKTITQMAVSYGTCPGDIRAQIGPGIHIDNFEVGDEVYDIFANEGFDMTAISRKFATKESGTLKWHIDLPECNRLQLVSAGVPASQISVSPVCTFNQSETYFSARRLGINSGRIFTGILLR